MSKFILQNRDINIVRAVNNYRYLLTGQIRKLVFPENKTLQSTRRRLRYLCHGNYLRRLEIGTNVSSLKSEAVFYLGLEGKRILGDLNEPIIPYPKNQISPLFLAHTLEVSEFRINLEIALKNNAKAKLNRFISEFELKANFHTFQDNQRFKIFHKERSLDGKDYPVYPDALFVIQARGSDYREFFFVEIDRGTVGLRRMLDKVIGYRLFLENGNFSKKFPGFEDFTILIQTNSKQRAENLRAKFLNDSGHDFVWITESSKVSEKTILSNIWRTGSGGKEFLVKD